VRSMLLSVRSRPGLQSAIAHALEMGCTNPPPSAGPCPTSFPPSWACDQASFQAQCWLCEELVDRQKHFREVVGVFFKICGVELMSRHAFSKGACEAREVYEDRGVIEARYRGWVVVVVRIARLGVVVSWLRRASSAIGQAFAIPRSALHYLGARTITSTSPFVTHSHSHSNSTSCMRHRRSNKKDCAMASLVSLITQCV
jgi:hypothetical protein